MTSRISDGSASVSATWPLACTTSIPTQESILQSDVWQQHLSIQDVTSLSAGDVCEWRVDGCEEGAGMELGFVQMKYYVEKTDTTTGITKAVGHIAPNLGLMSGVGHFARAEMFLNNTPVCSSYDSYPQVDLAQNLLTRNRADLNADAYTGGWLFDELREGGAVGIDAAALVPAAANGPIVAVAGQLDILNRDLTAANMDPASVIVGRPIELFATAAVGGTAAQNTAALPLVNGLYQGTKFRISAVAASNVTVNGVALPATRCTVAGLNLTAATTTANGAVYTYGFHATFPAMIEDDFAGMQVPAATLPLGRNRGALARRQVLMAGSHTGTGNPEQYTEFSFNYRPSIGAFSAKYIPSNTQVLLRVTMNQPKYMFRDYSHAAGTATSALSNYTIKYTGATLFVRKYKFSPTVSATLEAAVAGGEKIKIANRWIKSYVQRYPALSSTLEARSILVGEAARRYVVWVAPDAVIGGTPGPGQSSDQLTWESGNGQDIRQARLTINGRDIPYRMINQSTTSTTASGISALGSQDYATAWEMLRMNSVPQDPGLQSKDWARGSLKLLVFDNTLLGAPSSDNVSDPLLTNASVELRIDLSSPITVPYSVGIYGLYDSEIQIDAARNVMADLS